MFADSTRKEIREQFALLDVSGSSSMRWDHATVKIWVCQLCSLTINKSDHVRAALERPCFPSIAGNKARIDKIRARHDACGARNLLRPLKRLTCAGEGTGSSSKRSRGTKFTVGETARPPE